MKRTTLFLTICILAVLGITRVQAQGAFTLESLAKSIEGLVRKDDELESRIVALENQLGLVTATHTVTSTPTVTPTETPTPLPPATSFEAVRSAYTEDKDVFGRRFTGRNVYVKGRVSRLTSRTSSWVIEFRDGSLLDVTCHLSGSSHPLNGQLKPGDSVIVFGRARLDDNVNSDDELRIENCNVVYASEEEARAKAPQTTPTPQSTQATSLCSMQNVPEPPVPNLDCEIWKVTYQLVAIDLGVPPLESALPALARELYPKIESGAKACGVSPATLGDYLASTGKSLEEEGKPSASPNMAISYLIGTVGVEEFKEVVEMLGGCAEAIAFIATITE